MNVTNLTLTEVELQKLFATANADAAMLLLYLRCGNSAQDAARVLQLPQQRLECALATLRQLGLWQEQERTVVVADMRPSYTEKDVMDQLSGDEDFRSLCGEVQRRLGKVLSTEELKILLGMVRYLGLPGDVICVLISYCQDRAKQRGNLRNPSLRMIEKEAYRWAELGVDTLAESAAYIQNQNAYHSRVGGLLRKLQIRGRNLTAGEEKYLNAWVDMGFADDAIVLAYERTCLNTGGLNWAYMNKIMLRWHDAGLHTAAQVRTGDTKPNGGNGARQLDADEQAAIRRMLQED